MDLQFFGANCVSLTYKGTRVVVDDNLAELGGKPVLKNDDVALFTAKHGEVKAEVKLLVDMPGEYEIGDVSIIGVGAQAHLDAEGQAATMYKITAGDLDVLFVGHIYPELSEAQMEAIGHVDVMFVPVGGMGYTTDAVGALKLVKELEPKLIIPTHYADKVLKFPMPQTELQAALKELGMEPKEAASRLKLKPADLAVEGTQLQVLDRS